MLKNVARVSSKNASVLLGCRDDYFDDLVSGKSAVRGIDNPFCPGEDSGRESRRCEFGPYTHRQHQEFRGGAESERPQQGVLPHSSWRYHHT